MRLVRNILTLYVLVALLPFWVSGQQSLIIRNIDGEPVEDAVVVFVPQDGHSQQKLLLSNENGVVVFENQADVFFVLSRTGYLSVKDTLHKNESRQIQLKQVSQNLKEFVVTGQFEANAANKSVQGIKVIDRKRIEQQGAVSLRDVLTNELNISLSQDALLGSQIRMLGISGQNVKILIDGVPVIGRVDGNIDVSQINMNNVERIEIVEGPMSVIYGTDALGGVINLITKKPARKEYSASFNTYYETVGTYNVDAAVGFKYKKYGINISGGRNFFDGYSPVENQQVRWKQWKPKEQLFGEVQQTLKWKKGSYRLQANFFDEKITNRNNPVITPTSVTGYDDYFLTFRAGSSLYADYYFSNKATLNLINGYSYYRRTKYSQVKNLVTGEENPTSNPDDRDTSTFNLVLFRGTYTTHHSRKWNSQTGYDVNVESGSGKRLKDGFQQIGDFAGFYVAEYKPLSRLTLKPGVRLIYNTRYGTPVVPSLNLKYDLLSTLTMRASYARGFRAPSLKELSMYFVDVNHNIQGNPNLKAEVSDNYLLSFAYANNYKNVNLKSELTGFYNSIRNLINLAVTDPSQNSYVYLNIDVFKTVGTNYTFAIQGKRFSANLGTSLIGRYNQLSTVDSLNIPTFSYSREYKANCTYTLKKTKTDISLFYKYNGRAPGYAVDGSGQLIQTFVSAYDMMDASVTQPLWKSKVVLTAGVKNLFDVNGVSYNISGTAHSGGSGMMTIGMGRYYFTSIRISLGKN